MRICTSGARLFLAFLDGQISSSELMSHPAYQAVASHCLQYGDGMVPDDLDRSLRGEPSPFYGLKTVRENLPLTLTLLADIERNGEAWCREADAALRTLLPDEPLDEIVVYPIIGYDMGIGHRGVVCMNANSPAYWDRPEEFLYYMIHEVFHVIYERHHVIPRIAELAAPEQWLSFFHLMLQNEGFAVYAPLALRQERGHMDERDYLVLADPERMREHIAALLSSHRLVASDLSLNFAGYCDHLFGPMRLTYRVGCEMIRRVESVYGFAEVKKAAMLCGDEFWSRYGELLS